MIFGMNNRDIMAAAIAGVASAMMFQVVKRAFRAY